METLFIDAKWDEEVVLGDSLLEQLKEFKSVALFSTVQFLPLEKAKTQLVDAGIQVKTTKAKRTHSDTQVLGCDAYADSYSQDLIGECDAVLYVGDGMFHPKALLLAQIYNNSIRPIFIWDPVAGQTRTITVDDIKKQIAKLRANLKLFVASKTVGILVTTKPGQQYLELAEKLKDMLDKKAYIFLDDTFNMTHLEDYSFIDCWVNTACPRIGTDDIINLNKPLINIREAFDPISALEKLYDERQTSD